MEKDEEARLNELFEKRNLRIVTVVRDHMSGLLYATPYLRALRQQFPEAHIALLANSFAMSILQGCPYVDEILPFFQFRSPTGRFEKLKGLIPKGKAWLRLVGRTDLVIHFRYVGPDVLRFCATLGRPFQVGYAQYQNDDLLDFNLGPANTLEGSRQRNARILEALGIPCPSTEMEMWIAPGERKWVNKWLRSQGQQEGKPYIVLHPGCHWGCNEWLPERWSALGDALHEHHNARIIITGTEDEHPLAARIIKKMKAPAIIASGHTTLPQFAALLERARLVVAVDTAPTQICQALKIPAVILMGAGNPSWNGPLPGEPMILLQEWDTAEDGKQLCNWAAGVCHGPNCRSRLADISIDKVLTAATYVLPDAENSSEIYQEHQR